MGRFLLLCLVLWCTFANTTAARNLLMSPDRPTSDQSTVAKSPSPSIPASGGDFTASAPASSGDGRGAPAAAASPSSAESEKNGGGAAVSQAEQASELGQQRQEHRSSSYPVGGDVIIGGLATAFFAAIVCYIRVTRRRDDEEKL